MRLAVSLATLSLNHLDSRFVWNSGESLPEDVSLLDSRYFAQSSAQTTPSIESRESLERSPQRHDHPDLLGAVYKQVTARASKSDEAFYSVSLKEQNESLLRENEDLRRQLQLLGEPRYNAFQDTP